ncbi:DUF742 domain-containing protein [Fodinicola feengrottensis]|uniref:DUF742 domain-containing protein n=1 Tax=Fodinicola feengrottensis TaxID=435914 RepID=A0ABP4T2E1_9ACTN
MEPTDGVWYDESAGPLVRPYAVTKGRTRPAAAKFDLISVVIATQPADGGPGLEPEHVKILQLCRQPLSVAEIAAHVNLPAGVVKVLLDDLLQRDAIAVRAPMTRARQSNKRVLKAVINGIRAL